MMRPGELIDGRFEIEHHAGSGGMGHVYRGRDRSTGQAVALKILHSSTGALDRRRFAREAEALAAMRLPGVVRYIAHGATADTPAYLAMEWLEGETLSARLARQPLTLDESLELVGRIAHTLGAVHQLGIVHRDIKPSNLLLVDRTIENTTLIDFGVARMLGLEQQLTKPGTILGTPGYMAPEQARGAMQIDARADVFALGCVLYRCLTGRAAFEAGNWLAVMAKVILEEPQGLRELNENISEQLEELMARMLAKSPENRPRDGWAVSADLAALIRPLASGTRASRPDMGAPELTGSERKVMCLVLAHQRLFEPDTIDLPTRRFEHTEEIEALAARYGGKLELIGALEPFISLSGAVAPTDLAARAARCAMELQTLLSGAPVVLVTGRAELTPRFPVGELVDTAVSVLHTLRGQERGTGVQIDDVTAGLLGTRFETEHDDSGWWLRKACEELDIAPVLLGMPTKCVGRDRELAVLAAELRHCLDESTAGAMLVIGAAGIGKSRLRYEFLRAVQAKNATAEIWAGRGDPVSAGSAFSLLAHALRRAMGILDGEPLAARQQKIRARVERHQRLEIPRVTAFLGELVGAPFSDDGDVQLQAARSNPILMGDQIRLAWQEFLEAECATHPVVLVLEDLHWGDLPTVNLVDAGLRHAKEQRFFVLAFGRPEVRTLFPTLWQKRQLQEMLLTPLTRRASEQLILQALGAAASPELVARLVARTEGNAFFLEEQIRAAAEGRSDNLPETVLATVQARLEALPAEARRVLRAASLFGETFWQDGVAALVGGMEVAPWLLELTRREVVAPREAGRLQAQHEYRFRHTLVREAAYGMLTERDLRLGHALAGDWLARAGETDAMALAEHFERGGQAARAAAAWLRGAEEALRGDDLAAAIAHAGRGIACGAEPAIRGGLRRVQAEAYSWRGEFALAEEPWRDAITHLAAGSAAWFSAIYGVTSVAFKLDGLAGLERNERWLDAVQKTEALDGALSAKVVCLANCTIFLMLSGHRVRAEAILDAVERTMTERSVVDPVAVATLNQARAFRMHIGGDFSVSVECQKACLAGLEQAGNRREACCARLNLGFMHIELGDFEAAEIEMRAGLAEAERMGLDEMVPGALQNLGLILAHRGELAPARSTEEASAAAFQRLGYDRLEGLSRIYLARILLLAGDLDAADREARGSAELLQSTPPLRAYAIAVLAQILLASGQAEEALAAAREAFVLLNEVGAEEGESLIHLVHAEALATSGDQHAAEAVITATRDGLLTRAGKISDPACRHRFLHNVPENAHILELARTWLHEPP